jgi:bifunctional DNase/RNase
MKIRLKLIGITFSQVQAGAYALVLAEEDGVRRIPIIIGTPEAQSIAIFLEKLRPPRPLTHDLCVSLIRALEINLKEIFIYKYEDGIFFSDLIFSNGENDIHLDSRTSDAIALAIRSEANITINEEIMNEVGIEMEEIDFLDEQDENYESSDQSIDDMSLSELQQSLQDAVAAENYEKASYIRDLIKKKRDVS